MKVFTVIPLGSQMKTVQQAKESQIYLPSLNRLIASPNTFLTVHRYNPELPDSAIKVTFVRFDSQCISSSGDVHFTVGAGLPIARHKKFTSVPDSTVNETFAGPVTEAAS